MGDMTDMYRDFREDRRQLGAERLNAATLTMPPGQWTQHSEYHFSRTLAGKRLDWWPTTARWCFAGGRVIHGEQPDLEGFIAKRERV